MLIGTGLSCSSQDKPVRVEGKVTLDGQAIGGAAVHFVPQGKGQPAYAETEPDGTYKITTREPGDGALPGNYVVVIVWEPPPPPMFRSGESGPSRAEMQQAIEKHREAVRLSGKGVNIPAIYTNPSTTPLKVTVPAPGGKANFALTSTG
jgi:hypothetical protein